MFSIYKVLLLTSVECERNFSEYNRTKTKFGASIGEEFMKSLIILDMNVKEIYDIKIFIKKPIISWKNARERYFLDLDQRITEK